MPSFRESSTVEWQSAQVMPIALSRSPSKKPVTPSTLFALRSASVAAGSFRFKVPACRSGSTALGTFCTSTLRPSFSAVFGLTPGPTPPFFSPAMASCRRVFAQKASLPKVSKRKISRPWSMRSEPCALIERRDSGVAVSTFAVVQL